MSFQLNLDTETVARAFPRKALCVGASTPVAEVIALMQQENRGDVVVTDGERLLGIFTERDALRMMANNDSWDVDISSCMVEHPVTVSSDDTVATVIARMSSGGYRHLPVVDSQGAPKGMISVRGILHFLVEHFPKIVYTLPPNPHHSTQEREGA